MKFSAHQSQRDINNRQGACAKGVAASVQFNYLWAMLVAVAGFAVAYDARAAGFQISETSLSGLGRAFAGAGVAGDDASDLFYNPAGMFTIEGRQFQVGLTGLTISSDFNNNGSTQSLSTPAGRVTVPSRGGDSDGGDDAVVPNLFYVAPGNGQFKWGLGITAPFGLATEYDDDWVGRYHALKSELHTVELNPSFAWRLNENVALGAGLSVIYADAELSRALFLGPTSPDGFAVVDGDDTAFGANVGAMFTPNEGTRIGIGIRSSYDVEVDGTRDVSGTGVADGRVDAQAEVTLPETVYLSAAHAIDDKLTLLGSARWTNWSRFDELRISFADGSPDDVTEEDWDDSWTLSIGAAYRLNPTWTLRGGLSYDETPIPSVERRTPRIPDSDRVWLTFGASYQPQPNLTIDFGYAHIFGDDPDLDNTINLVSSAPGAFTDTLRGSYEDSDADLFGVQVRWQF